MKNSRALRAEIVRLRADLAALHSRYEQAVNDNAALHAQNQQPRRPKSRKSASPKE